MGLNINGFREVSTEMLVDNATGLNYKLISKKVIIEMTGDEKTDKIEVHYDKVYYDKNGDEFNRVGMGYITRNIYDEFDVDGNVMIEEDLKIKSWDAELGAIIKLAIVKSMKELHGII